MREQVSDRDLALTATADPSNGLLDEVLDRPVRAAGPERIDGVVIGRLVGLQEIGPVVKFPQNRQNEPVPAKTTAALAEKDIGREVALMFEGGDPRKPIIMGLIHDFQPRTEAVADGERLEFSADKEIVFRCGEASITLTKAGKVLIRGAYLLSRSSGANRIKGGSVQIN